MNDPATTLDRLAARAGHLYSLPGVAMKVLELTNNPQVDVRALKECIENDPALTGKILRVVNSSVFGLSRTVSDLNQAIALLGTKPLKLLVLGFSLPPSLFAGVAGEVLARYWRHTLTKAVAARELSETLWRAAGDDAFIAGLLQDIGMLLLIQQIGEPYVKFLDKVGEAGGDLLRLETQSLGFDHAALSARLLAQWGLPETLVEAVARRPATPEEPAAQDPARGSDRSLGAIVALAELVAQLLADGRRHVLPALIAAGERHQRWSPEQLDALVGQLQEKVEQLASVLNLQLPSGMEYRDLLAQAHVQLASVAADVAEDVVRQRSAAAHDADAALLQREVDLLGRAVDEALRQPAPAARRPVEEAPAPAATRDVPVTTPGPAVALAARPVARAAPDETELLEQLGAVVEVCRQARCGVSLLLAELDRCDPNDEDDEEDAAELCRSLHRECEELGDAYKVCLPYGRAGMAVILPRCERQEAVECGWLLVDGLRRLAVGGGEGGDRRASLSVGVAAVAVPHRGFPPGSLLDGARRCLYGSHASGGGVVKSIEIY